MCVCRESGKERERLYRISLTKGTLFSFFSAKKIIQKYIFVQTILNMIQCQYNSLCCSYRHIGNKCKRMNLGILPTARQDMLCNNMCTIIVCLQ